LRRTRLAAAALLLVAAACSRSPKLAAPDATYTVRGVILSLDVAQSGGAITIDHEAVPGFKNRDGKPEPMASMSMPFGITPDLPVKGLAPGDKIEFTWELRWDGSPPTRIVKITKLPPSTPLELGHGPHLEPVAPLGPGAPAITPAPEPASTPPVA